MSKRVGLVVNPHAGSGKAAREKKKIIKIFNKHGVEVVDLSHTDLKKAIKKTTNGLFTQKLDALVAAGGDGTVHHCLNIVAETDLPLGVIAIGSGNDAARSLGLPENNVNKSVNAVIKGLENGPKSVDLGFVSGLDDSKKNVWFLSSAGSGFIVNVTETGTKLKHFLRGTICYTLGIVWEILVKKTQKYRVVLDGKEYIFDSILFGVGICPDIGGGVRLFPNTSADNNLLEVVSVRNSTRRRFLKLLTKVKTTDISGEKEITALRGHNVSVEAVDKDTLVKVSDSIKIYADGEYIGNLPMSFTVVPKGVKILGAKPIHRTKLAVELSEKASKEFTPEKRKKVWAKIKKIKNVKNVKKNK